MAQQVLVKIDMEGKNLTHCMGLKIWQDLNKHHRFEILVPFELLESGDTTFFQQSHKVCGKKITISFEPRGLSATSANKDKFDFVFKGVITSISLRNQGDLANCFVIGGYSPTILMEDAVGRKIFKKMSINNVAEQVISSYAFNVLKKNLKASNQTTLPYIVQYNESNYAFLSRLADEYGEWFYYDGAELILGENQKKEVKFHVDGIQAFDMSILLKPAKFSLSGYIYADDKNCVGKSGSAKVDGLNEFGQFALDQSDRIFAQEALLRTDKPIFQQSDIDNLAKVKRSMKASSLVVFKGSGEIPNISIGTVVDVSGDMPTLGGRSTKKQSFGKYVVTEIEHTVDIEGNYSNNFKAIPDSVKHPPSNPEVAHPVGYPELATVTDHKDPEKLGRIRVKFLWPGEAKDAESDWIRVGSFYSGGDGLGMFFLPEVGAQVVVGYEQNHPEYPFVITSVYPKRNKVRTAAEKNELKFFQTMAGNQISIDDKDGSNRIEITNINKPDTSITIDFKEPGIITLKTKGDIQIQADKNISIVAKEQLSLEAKDIHIKANNNLKCEAKMNADIEAMDLIMKANKGAELKGTATVKVEGAMAEVKASGINTIKGSVVKIN